MPRNIRYRPVKVCEEHGIGDCRRPSGKRFKPLEVHDLKDVVVGDGKLGWHDSGFHEIIIIMII